MKQYFKEQLRLTILVSLLFVLVFVVLIAPLRCSVGLDSSGDVVRTFGSQECFAFYESGFWTQTDSGHYVSWKVSR